MNTNFFGILLPLPEWLVWSSFLVLCSILGFLLGYLFRVVISQVTKRTTNKLDDIFIKSFAWPINLSLALVAFFLAVELTPYEFSPNLSVIAQSAILLFFMIGGIRFISKWVDWLGEKNRNLRHSTGILKPLLIVVMAVVVGLMIASRIGYDILPILTGLGVGGVAVALALQSTLSNFFAGITLIGDRLIHEGNFIRLESGLQGWVRAITWRATMIETYEHMIVIIPNQKLADSIVTNFHLPKSWIIEPIDISVSYASDPETVQQAVLDEVRKLSQENKFILQDPPPSCRFHPGFGESSLNFTLRVAVESFEDVFATRDLIRKKVFARFRKEGIVIPFPQRDIHIKETAGTDLILKHSQ